MLLGCRDYSLPQFLDVTEVQFGGNAQPHVKKPRMSHPGIDFSSDCHNRLVAKMFKREICQVEVHPLHEKPRGGNQRVSCPGLKTNPFRARKPATLKKQINRPLFAIFIKSLFSQTLLRTRFKTLAVTLLLGSLDVRTHLFLCHHIAEIVINLTVVKATDAHRPLQPVKLRVPLRPRFRKYSEIPEYPAPHRDRAVIFITVAHYPRQLQQVKRQQVALVGARHLLHLDQNCSFWRLT